MPRRRRNRRSRQTSRGKILASTMAISSSPASVVDSDHDSTSLPSSVCDDYYEQLLAAGQDHIISSDVEPLDLAAGLVISTDDAPADCEESLAPPSSLSSSQKACHPMTSSHTDEPKTSTQSIANPSNLFEEKPAPRQVLNTLEEELLSSWGVAPTPEGVKVTAKVNAPVRKYTELSPEAIEFVPAAITFLPSSASGSSASAQSDIRSKDAESHSAARPTVPNPYLNRLNSFDRKAWGIVESEAMDAFRFFQTHAKKGTTYSCVPMTQPKVRLGMHRAAEAMGATTASQGSGQNRHVVITWNKNGVFPISEAAVLGAVRSMLTELFEPVPTTKRDEKRARRREKKLAAEAEFRDFDVDEELLEILIANRDWYGVDRLYAGVPVPGLKKKMTKSERKRAREAARGGFSRDAQIPQDEQNSSQEKSNWKQSSRSDAALMAPPLETNNKGYSMLEKMGWKEGQGLGADTEGMTQPIRPDRFRERVGLGN